MRRPVALPRDRASVTALIADAYIMFIGIGTSFSVRLVGDLPIGEILLVLGLPVALFFRARKALRPELKLTYLLMLLWLIGQLIADVYNQIPLDDRLRGNASIVFFGIDLLGLSLFLGRDQKRKRVFLIGLAIGALAQVKLQPSPAMVDYPWKFGYATGCMEVALLISSYLYWRRKMFLSALPILFICGVNLVMNYRSPVLDLLVTLALLYPIIPERLGSVRLLPRAGTVGRIIVLATFVMLAGLAALNLVHFVTRQGYISEEDKEKNEDQAQAGGLLLGGRPEFRVGLRAALDSPIIGHGSWPNDRRYIEILADMEAEQHNAAAYGRLIANGEGSLIPTHSHVVGSWVFGGLLGLIFWLYIIAVVLRGVIRITVFQPALAPIYMWLLITMFWDIWFSPFASFRRLIEAFLLIVIADLPRIKSRVKSRRWVRSGAVRPALRPALRASR